MAPRCQVRNLHALGSLLGTWYPYNMYRPGNEQYDYHLETYGPPEKFGYKDFIPMFTAEHFDGFWM